MINLNFETFPFQKTFLIAFVGAIIGQTIIILISWAKRKIDLFRKQKMILADLNNQNKILDLVTAKYKELDMLLDQRKTDEFTSSIFHNLQLDIYESVPKHELYSIFKKDLQILVEVYKSIEFIEKNSPYRLYIDYLEKSEQHQKEKENDPNHEFYCLTELGFITIAKKNIDNHLKTIKDTKQQIEKLAAKKRTANKSFIFA